MTDSTYKTLNGRPINRLAQRMLMQMGLCPEPAELHALQLVHAVLEEGELQEDWAGNTAQFMNLVEALRRCKPTKAMTYLEDLSIRPERKKSPEGITMSVLRHLHYRFNNLLPNIVTED